MYELNKYKNNGFATPIPVLSKQEATELAGRVQSLKNEDAEVAERALGTNCHLLLPAFYNLTSHSLLLEVVEQVLGPDILLWSTDFFIKAPRSKGFVSWHQDSTYWGLEPPDIVTAWLALTPSNLENGCMQLIPGSHKKGQLDHHDTFAESNMLSRGQVLEVDLRGETIVAVELQPGEMSLHHVRIFHSSGENESDIPRIGYVMRFIPTYVRQKCGRTHAILVRGQDQFQHFGTPTPPPLTQLGEAEWVMHQQTLKRLNVVVLKDASQQSKVRGHQILNNE